MSITPDPHLLRLASALDATATLLRALEMALEKPEPDPADPLQILDQCVQRLDTLAAHVRQLAPHLSLDDLAPSTLDELLTALPLEALRQALSPSQPHMDKGLSRPRAELF